MSLQCIAVVNDHGEAPLYRYMSSRRADEALSKGAFKIGTLHEYQAMEVDPELSDREEGTKTVVYSADRIALFSVEEFRRTFQQCRIPDRNGGYVKESELTDIQVEERLNDYRRGCPVAMQTVSPNCYVMCLSTIYDVDLMKRFRRDACIQIVKPLLFFQALTAAKATFDKVNSCFVEACVYTDRLSMTDPHPVRERPQILKETRHAHQHEVRALWDPWDWARNVVPADEEIQPFVVVSPKAALHCRRIV